MFFCIRTLFFCILFASSLNAAVDQFPTYSKAAFYHYNSRPQWNLAFETLQNFPLNRDETILNVGCRSGRVAAYLSSKVPLGKVIGLDPSAGMIDFARANHNQNLFHNLSFVHQDVLKGFSPSTFDRIVSFSALHWTPEQDLFLENVYQALKPRGKILFTIPAAPLKGINATFADLSAKAEWKEYFQKYHHPRKKYTATEYRAFLEKAGFRNIEVETLRFHYAFETVRELIDCYRAFAPFLLILPKPKHAQFLEDFAHSYINHCPCDADGRIPFVEDHLIIRAEK